jgi:hypothetical protein
MMDSAQSLVEQGAKRVLRSELRGGLYTVELWEHADKTLRVRRRRFVHRTVADGFQTDEYLPKEGPGMAAAAYAQYEEWVRESSP